MKDHSRRVATLAAALVLTLGGGLAAVPALQKARAKPRPTPTPVGVTGGVDVPKGSWKEVDRLVGEQKLEEASRLVANLLRVARASGDETAWTKALVREVQLRIALHGYETAVRFLKDEAWPSGTLSRATLDLFYADALVTYQNAYSWEVGQRERVESKGPVDLKAWTRDQIFEEAGRALDAVWKGRAALGGEPVATLSEYVQPNDYPKGIRGTLRDAVTYLWVEQLANTAGWRPEQSNEVFALDLAALVAGDAKRTAAIALADPAVHPIVKIGALLDDLEAWHASRGEEEAALEARLERLRRLHASFTGAEDRARVRKDLEGRLPALRALPWWSMGMGELAEMVRAEDAPDALVRARAIAEEGRRGHPTSTGGQRCRSIVASIEAPDFQIATMSSDAAGKRSLEISHKNLRAVYFRAYPMDLEKRLATAKDYGLLPQWNELDAILKGGAPGAEWKAELPATPDYRSHRTYVTPPMTAPGLWVVFASAKPGFGRSGNRLLAVSTIVGDLVLLSRNEPDGSLSVRTVSGETGAAARADVTLWRFDWQKGHRKVETRSTDAAGETRFEGRDGRDGGSHFLVARRGDDLALDPAYVNFWKQPTPGETSAALVYTDRSVYRPNQKLFFKVVAYRGSASDARYRTQPEASVAVNLVDPNGQVVETRNVTTNAFGTASGEMAIPTGRLLGAWRLQTGWGGATAIRVEEYKRPTFEAKFADPKEPLRLNRPAALRGEVAYYFGLPVVNGTARWRVTRQPQYPWWWGWWWHGPVRNEAQVVATGTSPLEENGSFAVAFTPKADERDAVAARDVTYRFDVSADVTDEGGETRSATRSFRLGFVALEASVRLPGAFLRAGVDGTATVHRASLDGVARPGAGTWRLLALKQPAATALPADEAVTSPKRAGEYRTAGDAKRPRWQPQAPLDALLRSWEDGKEVASGKATHDEKGDATLALPSLEPGAWRLRYETTDEFGAVCKASKDFVVAARETPLASPAVLLAESASVPVGDTARLLVASGLPNQPYVLDLFRGGVLRERRRLVFGKAPALVEIPVTEADRGGFGVTLSLVRDHQLLQQSQTIFVPWDDRELDVSFSTFRDKLRPGATETWKVTVKAKKGPSLAAGAAEVLAYMYDRSLDVFAPHTPPSPLGLYPWRATASFARASLGTAAGMWIGSDGFPDVPGWSAPTGDRLRFADGYGVGGPGRRFGYRGKVAAEGMMLAAQSAPAAPAPAAMRSDAPARALAKSSSMEADKLVGNEAKLKDERAAGVAGGDAEAAGGKTLRSDFAETAFFRPHLLAGADGAVSFEFTVPDSVTSWNVWAHAVTRDLRGGATKKEATSVKELMVRPYLPRFFREGDEAELKVVVNDAAEKPLSGAVTLEVFDPATNEDLAATFGLPTAAAGRTRPFKVDPKGSTSVTFPVKAPKGTRQAAFKVVATAGDLSDGELRPVPVLPGRMHLVQSRFVTLRNQDRRTLRFEDLAKDDDPSRVNDQLVVTVDAQLFYTVLQSLPYLVNYPYECTEQTLNRFVSTGIVSKLYADYPAVQRMAQEMSKRTTPLETWDAVDPNRKMALEETPWVVSSKGGTDAGHGLTNVLDSRIAKADRDAALAKLRKAQTSIGGFPWWPGGPPSPWMTLYIAHGLAKATEFGVDVPKDMVQRAWSYLAIHYRDDVKRCMAHDGCWEFVTFLNYVASCYPDETWTGNALTPAERKEMLDFSFAHWKRHTPYLKGYLALTLKRLSRPADARLVWDSVMDSAKTTDDQGTFWAPEDRSWLWYADTIETHAFALRTLMELDPKDGRRDGLVQWLLLNKKLNHWKSTRATAEVVYSLIHYLKAEGALAVREDASVTVGSRTVTFVFEPDAYTGKKNQVVVEGPKIDPKADSTVVVSKESKGFAFASATWHFSTERLPQEASGDFFQVTRRYFRRDVSGREAKVVPLEESAVLAPGDEVEVRLSIRAKHEAEYVHLRDPRAAGLEPENAVSRWRWDLGIARYEEVRDSGTNFFFEKLPPGEYTMVYRLRANLAGTFRVSPATLQSMYAPEFAAYSAGNVVRIGGAK